MFVVRTEPTLLFRQCSCHSALGQLDEDPESHQAPADPGRTRGLKRKQLSFDESEEGEIDEEDEDEDPPANFDLFASTSPKKDWDDHPDMKKLIKTGKAKLDKIGFSSPKPETQNVTMHELAIQYNVSLPKKREAAVPILVRALAIARIKLLDKAAVEKYTDLKK